VKGRDRAGKWRSNGELRVAFESGRLPLRRASVSSVFEASCFRILIVGIEILETVVEEAASD
jgi:hypothetical protein